MVYDTEMNWLEFSTIDALAEFWDTHDITDFMEAFETLTEPIFERQGEPSTQLSPDEVQQTKLTEKDR